MLQFRNLLMTWAGRLPARNRFGCSLGKICVVLLLFVVTFCNGATPPKTTAIRDKRQFFLSNLAPQQQQSLDALPNDVRQNLPPPLSEAELYQSVPYESLKQGYGDSNEGRIERIDNPLQQLPDVVEQMPTQEVVLNYQFPDERPPDRVINNVKQIHDYAVQRRFVRTQKRVTHKYTKNVFLNTIYNTNIQKVNHKKLVNVLQNTLQEISVPKLIVHYTRASTTNTNFPAKDEPVVGETVQEETKQLPTITEPTQVELIVQTPDPCGASSPSVAADWELFKKRFGKAYVDAEEERKRKIIWACNLGAIDKQNEEYNRGHQAFSMGMNTLGDLTAPEFDGIYNGARTTEEDDGRGGCSDHTISGQELPTTVDWRTMDIVSPVKDQDECGSCWAFSAIGALESQQAIKLNHTRLLSEQRLVDCSRPEGNMGCDGGYPNHAFTYVMKHGIDVAADYPYAGINDTCQVNGSTSAPSAMAAATAAAAAAAAAAADSSDDVVKTLRVLGCKNIPQGNEKALMDALATVGPVAVCIDSSQTSFQFYAGGVYDPSNCSSAKVDHGMLAVGYGTLDGKDYYLIKNSYGPSWGVDGYMYLARGKNNRCGITTTASYPVVEKPPPRILTTTTTTTTTPQPPIVYYNYYYPAYGYNGPPGNYPYEPPYGGTKSYSGYGGQKIGYRSSLPPSSPHSAMAARSNAKTVNSPH